MLDIWFRCASEMQTTTVDTAGCPSPTLNVESEQKIRPLALLPEVQVAAHQQMASLHQPISTFMFNGCTYALPNSTMVDGPQGYVIMSGGADGNSSSLLHVPVQPNQIQWTTQSDVHGVVSNAMPLALSKAANDMPARASLGRYEGPTGQMSCLSQLANHLRGFTTTNLPSCKGILP